MDVPPPDCDIMDDSTNVYVQELKNVFELCRESSLPIGYINQCGLVKLCSHLQLNDHCSYIIGQLAPFPHSLIHFPEFKQKFVQILPEIVDFESSRESKKEQSGCPFETGGPEQKHESIIFSENDTSNDILSDELSNNQENLESGKTLKLLPRSKTSTPQFLMDNKKGTEPGKESLENVLEQLGIAEDGYLGRYESRVLCQHLTTLTKMSDQTIRDIFEVLDTDKDGRISVHQFRNGFLNQSPKIGNSKRNFETFSKDRSWTFFSAIDPNSTGSTLSDTRGKAEHYWQELQNVNQRQSILIEELDQSQSHLEQSNEKKLRDIESRYNSELRSYHSKWEKEKDRLVEQVDELENAIKVKATTETTLHKRVAQLEKDNSRLRKDNKDYNQTIEEFTTLNSDLKQELEKSTGLAKKALKNHFFDSSLGSNSSLWKHKADLLTAENKRLKDQVDELWENCNRNKMAIGSGVIKKPMKSKNFVRNTPMTASFRKAVQDKIKTQKKKRNLNDSDEFESDPEPIFYRPRVRKYLKNRQRREKIERRLTKISENHISRDVNLNLPSSSEENEAYKTVVVHNSKLSQLKPNLDSSFNGPNFAALRRQISEDRKQAEFQYKMEMSTLEENHKKEIEKLHLKFESEKIKLKETYEKELKHLLEAAKQQQEEFALKIEQELKEKHDLDKRDMEIKWATEKNDLERHFAEDKMMMMAKLQDDFEVELRRSQKGVASSPPPMGRLNSSKIETLEREKKILSESLEGQRNGYESRLTNQSHDFQSQINQLKDELADATDWLTPEDMPRRLKDRFYALMDEWKDRQQTKLAQDKDDTIRGFSNEREELVSTLESEKSVLVKQHAAQLIQLESRYSAGIENLKLELNVSQIELKKLQNLLQEYQKETEHKEIQVHEVELDGDSRDELLSLLEKNCSELESALESETNVKGELKDLRREFEWLQNENLVLKGDFENLKSEKEPLKLEEETQTDNDKVADFESENVELKNRLDCTNLELKNSLNEQSTLKGDLERLETQLDDLRNVERGAITTQTDISGQDLETKDQNYNSHLENVKQTLNLVQSELSELKRKPFTSDASTLTLTPVEEPIQIMPFDPFLTSDPFEGGGLTTIQEETEVFDGITQTHLTMQHIDTEIEETTLMRESLRREREAREHIEDQVEMLRNKSIANQSTQTYQCDTNYAICQTDIENLEEILELKDTKVGSLQALLTETEAKLCKSDDLILSLNQENLKKQISFVDFYMQTDEFHCEECEIAQIRVRKLESELNKHANNSEVGCRRCLLLESRINELEQAMQLTSESGIEEMSGAEAYEDISHLRKETDRLRRKLEDAQEKVLDLKTCLAVVTSQQIRKSCSEKSLRSLLKTAPNLEMATEDSSNLHFHPKRRKVLNPDFANANGDNVEEEGTPLEQYLANQLEYVRQDNFLLNERLKEKEILLQEIVQEYKDQMKATAQVGTVLMDVCKIRNNLQT